jgi:hypothetical protein
MPKAKRTARSSKPKRSTRSTKTKPGRKTNAVRNAPVAAGRRPRRSGPGRVGPVNEWMELRGSSIHGLGAFARKPIPKGTRVIEYTGEKITNAEADRRYDDYETAATGEHHTVLFILNKKMCIDATFGGNEARFINHSCDPNCEPVIPRGHIWIEAIRNIPAGAELSYDYSYDNDPAYTEKDLRFYGCQCGSPKCRGTIVDTKRLLKS